MRLYIVSILLTFFSLSRAISQEVENEFFTFLNMMEGDTVSRTLEYNLTYIQSVGYNGVGYNIYEDLKKTKEILDNYEFKTTVVDFKVNIDLEELDPSLKEKVKLLKGSKAILTPSFYSESGKYNTVSKSGDQRVKKLTQQLAKWARQSKLEIAISPQFGYYIESHRHAYALAKDLGKMSIGFCFNLSQWLATEDLEGRNSIYSELMDYRAKLKVVTINGANRVISKRKNPFDDYLLPLGKGSFNTFTLIEHLIKKQDYNGPIGVQCDGLTGDKMQMAEDVMLVWKSYLFYMKERKED